jgi:hypothetical protein
MRTRKLRNELNPYEIFIEEMTEHYSLKTMCEFVLKNYCADQTKEWRDTAPTLIFAAKLLKDIQKTQSLDC